MSVTRSQVGMQNLQVCLLQRHGIQAYSERCCVWLQLAHIGVCRSWYNVKKNLHTCLGFKMSCWCVRGHDGAWWWYRSVIGVNLTQFHFCIVSMLSQHGQWYACHYLSNLEWRKSTKPLYMRSPFILRRWLQTFWCMHLQCSISCQKCKGHNLAWPRYHSSISCLTIASLVFISDLNITVFCYDTFTALITLLLDKTCARSRPAHALDPHASSTCKLWYMVGEWLKTHVWHAKAIDTAPDGHQGSSPQTVSGVAFDFLFVPGHNWPTKQIGNIISMVLMPLDMTAQPPAVWAIQHFWVAAVVSSIACKQCY